MASVCLWEPKNGLFGHCSLMLDDGQYISFWPIGNYGKSDFSTTVPSYGSTYANDCRAEGREPTSKLPIRGQLDYAAIRAWWAQNSDRGYNIPDRHCATMVLEALRVGGLNESEYIIA